MIRTVVFLKGFLHKGKQNLNCLLSLHELNGVYENFDDSFGLLGTVQGKRKVS